MARVIMQPVTSVLLFNNNTKLNWHAAAPKKCINPWQSPNREAFKVVEEAGMGISHKKNYLCLFIIKFLVR